MPYSCKTKYALLSTIARTLQAQITLEIKNKDKKNLKDFKILINMVLGISGKQTKLVLPASLYRVGTTNAANRGLDISANFGLAIQVKHLTLTAEIVEDIADNITTDRIVIVCLDAEKLIIESLLKQVSLGERIQGIIAMSDLDNLYKLCLNKKYCNKLEKNYLKICRENFQQNFPQSKKLLHL